MSAQKMIRDNYFEVDGDHPMAVNGNENDPVSSRRPNSLFALVSRARLE